MIISISKQTSGISSRKCQIGRKNKRNLQASRKPVINLEGFQLDELDSYSSLTPVKKESNPKPPATPKPTGSKTATAPKGPPTYRTWASSSRKRKEVDYPAAPHAFPFENYGFTESSTFTTGFLNQGLERLVFLYEDACGTNVMLENKLKKAEATITD
ncbi:hypothetical protein Hanom_Chr17g01572971 [Helianthus anomalus]